MPQALGAAIFAGIEAIGVAGAVAAGEVLIAGVSVASLAGSAVITAGAIGEQTLMKMETDGCANERS